MVGVSSSPMHDLLTSAFCRHPTGTPFYIDTCQATAGWDPLENPAGFVTTTALGEAFNGVQGFKLTTPAAGRSGIYRYMAIPHHKKLGMEVNFALRYSVGELPTVLTSFTFGFIYSKAPGSIYWAGASWYILPPATGLDFFSVWRNYFLPTPHKFLDLTGLQAGHGHTTTWQNAKIIVDLDTLKFNKLYWNELEADISNVPFGLEVGSCWNDITAYVSVDDNGPPIDVYLGNIILTFED